MSSAARPHRHTRHREEVAALLAGTNEFLSAQRAHSLLREQHIAIGLTTVYRILQALAEDGVVDVVRTSAGELAYRRCSPRHHHHLMCRTCARTVEVDGPAIERWAATVAAYHGFRDVNHNIELFGTCTTCATGGSDHS